MFARLSYRVGCNGSAAILFALGVVLPMADARSEILTCEASAQWGPNEEIREHYRVNIVVPEDHTDGLVVVDRDGQFRSVVTNRIGSSIVEVSRKLSGTLNGRPFEQPWSEAERYEFVVVQEGSSQNAIKGFYVHGSLNRSVVTIRADVWKSPIEFFLSDQTNEQHVATGECE